MQNPRIFNVTAYFVQKIIKSSVQRNQTMCIFTLTLKY